MLVLLYLSLATDHFGYLVVTFIAAFALVLSHQLATFLAVFIMPPILLYDADKIQRRLPQSCSCTHSWRRHSFLPLLFPSHDRLLRRSSSTTCFSPSKPTLTRFHHTSFNSFLVDFGFILFFAIAGIGVSFYRCLNEKKLVYFVILMLSFFVPFFFAESYFFGLYMPFQWFMYYLTPPWLFSRLFFLFLQQTKSQSFYAKNKGNYTKKPLKNPNSRFGCLYVC